MDGDIVKVIVTAGGTGGHIYPALSVIEKILSEKGNEVLYIGTKNRMESKLIPEKVFLMLDLIFMVYLKLIYQEILRIFI